MTYTTTLTRKVTKSVPVAVGDVFRGHGEVWIVEEVDPTRHDSMRMKWLTGEQSFTWYSPSTFCSYTHLQNGVKETTREVEEEVVVEHRWHGGDTIAKRGTKWIRTITAVCMSSDDTSFVEGKQPRPCYAFGARVGRWADSIEHYDTDEFVLVSGPSARQREPEWDYEVGQKLFGLGGSIIEIIGRGWHDEISEWVYWTATNPKIGTYLTYNDSIRWTSVEPEPMKPIEILKTARELISVPEKWTKGMWQTIGGRMCLSGAIRRAAGALHGGGEVPLHNIAARMTAAEALEDIVGTSIVVFNDDPKTTHADVLRVLDRVIQLFEPKTTVTHTLTVEHVRSSNTETLARVASKALRGHSDFLLDTLRVETDQYVWTPSEGLHPQG